MKTSLARAVQGVFPPEDETQVLVVACEFPSRFDLPLGRFILSELVSYILDHLDIGTISRSTIWPWLQRHALRSWKSRMWPFPRDPHFLAKATPVVELYHGYWLGQPLGPSDFVICAGEKPGIRVLERRHPLTPPQLGCYARIEYEYIRHGTVAYLAALDVHSGRVIGRVNDDRKGIEPFKAILDFERQPYGPAVSLELYCQRSSGSAW